MLLLVCVSRKCEEVLCTSTNGVCVFLKGKARVTLENRKGRPQSGPVKMSVPLFA